MSWLKVDIGTIRTEYKENLPSIFPYLLPPHARQSGVCLYVCLWSVYMSVCHCVYICSYRQSTKLILKPRQASELLVLV